MPGTQVLTPAALAAIEARVAAATPGPWAYEPHGDTGDYGVGVLLDDDDNPVTGYQECGVCVVAEPVAPEVSHHSDADFIAHAREDVPALLAHIRRLEAEREAEIAAARNAALKEAAELMDATCVCTHPCEDYLVWPGPCGKQAGNAIRALRAAAIREPKP